jgi:hypothetical protein
MRKGFRVALSLLLSSMLVDCASRDELAKRIAGRWGPDPIIDAGEVASVVSRQVSVLLAIAKDARIGRVVSTDPPLVELTPADWYLVAQWGFNLGREDCAVYLNNIFKIQREKLRNHDLINAFQLATIGIVTATAPHSPKTLSILGQAFGLTTALNDTILQSYLFTEAPGLISIKIKQLQDEYQKSVKPADIKNAATAYSALQNYYNICLPQSIEGVVLERVAKSEPVSGDKPKATVVTTKVTTTPEGNTPAPVQKTPLLGN